MGRTTLVVGNETLTSPELVALLADRAAAGNEVHVVVPAKLLSEQDEAWAHSEGLVPSSDETIHVVLARHRLQRALQDLAGLGIEADGHVGDPDPLTAVVDAVERVSPVEVVVSTLPRRASRWLARDLPSRVEKQVDVPVTVVELVGVSSAG